MGERTELTTVEHVREEGSFLFTATDTFDMEEEILVVPCEDGPGINGSSPDSDGNDDVTAWINRCTHEAQRLDTGRGVSMREGQIVCPRHGSMFDACSGECDNGDAAGSTLPDVDVAVEDGTIYLTDEDYSFAHEGGIDSSDRPGSTSHIGF